MSKFAIYNYNFLRIIEPNVEHQLEFPDWENVNVKESFENRQQLLEELLLADYDKPFQFENARKKLYWHKQIVKPQDNVYVMRVANVTNVTITDEHLKSQKYADYRNCLVIIDNRPGIQRIAIEQKSKAFSRTKTVANIIEASFCKLLKSKLLKVKLSAVFGTNVFWNMLDKYPNGFSKVTFHFPHLNLDRLTKAMDNYLKTAREDWDSDLSFTLEQMRAVQCQLIATISVRQHLLLEHLGQVRGLKCNLRAKRERLYYAVKTNSWCANLIQRCSTIC